MNTHCTVLRIFAINNHISNFNFADGKGFVLTIALLLGRQRFELYSSVFLSSTITIPPPCDNLIKWWLFNNTGGAYAMPSKLWCYGKDKVSFLVAKKFHSTENCWTMVASVQQATWIPSTCPASWNVMKIAFYHFWLNLELIFEINLLKTSCHSVKFNISLKI